MVFALASRTLRTSSYRSLLSQTAGARRGYAEAVSDKLKLSFVVPHQVGGTISYSNARRSTTTLR